MTALARALQARGHEIAFLGVPDSESLIRGAGLPFLPFLESEFPHGAMTRLWSPVAHRRGLEILEYTLGTVMPALLKPTLGRLEGILSQARIDAMVIDMAYSFAQLAPMRMNLPFVQIWNVLHRDPTGATPPSSFSWPHETTPAARERNKAGLRQVGRYFAPLAQIGRAFAAETKLAVDWEDPNATTSRLAVISQTPRVFDFPDIPWPSQFHYAGPFHDGEGRAPVEFPWEELSGDPLIYVSLGTVVNAQPSILKVILGAVAKLSGVQTVLAAGKNFDRASLQPLPANLVVVPEAPQVSLLKRASLCITHAGLNTALEALCQGAPMVAIPIGYDQPGVAARIAYHGVGEFIEADDLSVESLLGMLQRVLTEPVYRAKSARMREAVAASRGLAVAADVIEQSFSAAPR